MLNIRAPLALLWVILDLIKPSRTRRESLDWQITGIHATHQDWSARLLPGAREIEGDINGTFIWLPLPTASGIYERIEQAKKLAQEHGGELATGVHALALLTNREFMPPCRLVFLGQVVTNPPVWLYLKPSQSRQDRAITLRLIGQLYPLQEIPANTHFVIFKPDAPTRR